MLVPLAKWSFAFMFSRSLHCFALVCVFGSQAVAQDPVWQSKVINTLTPGHAVDIDVDVTGAKELYLVVRDAGDSFTADWADWAEPRLVSAAGEKKLTDLKWKLATADWGQVRINQNAEGGPLKISGKPVEYGIGVHANSVVAFDLPPTSLASRLAEESTMGDPTRGILVPFSSSSLQKSLLRSLFNPLPPLRRVVVTPRTPSPVLMSPMGWKRRSLPQKRQVCSARRISISIISDGSGFAKS